MFVVVVCELDVSGCFWMETSCFRDTTGFKPQRKRSRISLREWLSLSWIRWNKTRCATRGKTPQQQCGRHTHVMSEGRWGMLAMHIWCCSCCETRCFIDVIEPSSKCVLFFFYFLGGYSYYYIIIIISEWVICSCACEIIVGWSSRTSFSPVCVLSLSSGTQWDTCVDSHPETPKHPPLCAQTAANWCIN